MDIQKPKVGDENLCLNLCLCYRGAGYGLEIPVQYRFNGAKKAVEWAEKNIIFFLKT